MTAKRRMITRREALGWSAGTLLSLGLWPGLARGQDGGRFRFVVMNDTHYIDEQCGAWLRRVMAQVKREKPDFCIVAGDLTEHGAGDHLAALRDVLRDSGVPSHVVIGNHDYATHTDRSAYEKVFPNQLNYWFEHKGWQFVGLDTTEGTRYQDTRVQNSTLGWLEDNLGKLDQRKPTVVFTHFPLGQGVQYRPSNADAVLEKFHGINLRGVFSGHFHGYTQRRSGEAVLTTNCCCALKRGNHDGTTEKGYVVCEAAGQEITRTLASLK